LQESLLGSAGLVVARPPTRGRHWRRALSMPEMAGPWTFSPFSTGGDLQRKIKSQKPVDFSCFSLFSDLLFPLFFKSAESGAGRYTRRRRQAGRVDSRISNFPLPPSFLHRRCRPPLPRLGDRHP